MDRKQLYNLIIIALLIVSSLPMMTFNNTVKSTYGAGTGIWVVSTTGDDSTGVGTLEDPFASLRKAINASSNGETIYLRGGDYNNVISTTGIRINRSSLTISSYPGESAVINGNGYTINSGYGLISIGSGTLFYDNTTLRDLTITNSSLNGITAYATDLGDSENNTIDNCSFVNITYRAVYFYNINVPVNYHENNTVSNCTFSRIQVNSSNGECVTFMGCKNFIFENNYMELFTKQGVSCGGSGACYGKIRNNVFNNIYYTAVKMTPYIYGDKSGHHIEICNNTFYGAADPTSSVNNIYLNPEEDDNYIHNVSIHDNIINVSSYDDYYSHGINIYTSSANTNVIIENVSIYHNTIYCRNGINSTCFRVTEGGSSLKNIVVANNIFTSGGNTRWQVVFKDLTSAQTNVTMYNNLYYQFNSSMSTWRRYFTDSQNTTEATGITSNPLFVNASDGNFHLNYSSPAIDAGNSVYVSSSDFDGILRPQNGSYDIGAYEYSDDTPPTIIINFAGNLSDKGGPYWLPPGESTVLTQEGYYTNDSHQSEDWIYINLTVNDTGIGVYKVFLHWYNQTANSWLNTSEFTHTAGDYWEYNKTGVPQGKYSFDILANDTFNNQNLTWWNKTGFSSAIIRRYVSLNNTPVNISYTPLYIYDTHTDLGSEYFNRDILQNDQGVDDGNYDTGYLTSVVPDDTLEDPYCTSYLGMWYNDTKCVAPFNMNNVYYHLWYGVKTGVDSLDKIGVNKTRRYNSGITTTMENYTAYNNDSRSFVYVAGAGSGGLYPKNFNLTTHLLPITSTPYTDNDIYEFSIKAVYQSQLPSIVSNRSFTSFILLNVPDNATLNASYADSDSDSLSDWNELYTTYTNPFLSDTDNDGYTDYIEYFSGDDPNDYTDYGSSPFIFLNELPTNNTLSVVSPTCNVTIQQIQGYQFNVSIFELQGTSWFNKSYSTNGVNGSFSFVFTNASDYSRTYSWMVCAMNRSVWHNETYSFTTYGMPGSNLRSDGSHLFMTMEDGITPNIEIIPGDRGTIAIDTNSTIEGKYCVNINRSVAQQDHANLLQPFFLDGDMQSCDFVSCGYAYGSGIMPSSWSIKFMVKERTGGDYLEFNLAYFTESSDSFYFTVHISFSDNTIYVTDYLTNRYFTTMHFQTGCIYTLTLDNIMYRPKDAVTKISNLCDVTLSNATSSETIADVDFYGNSVSGYDRILPIAEFCWTLANAPATIDLYFDDWTVGTQSNISTTALPLTYPVLSSVINETRATIPGYVYNDGSPLQNNSEFNNTVSVLYDTVPHNTKDYTYYFNDYNINSNFTENNSIIDNDENTYGKFNYTQNMYENYNIVFVEGLSSYAGHYASQTFTVGTVSTNEDHYIASVNLELWRKNSPGNYVVSITETNGAGEPILPPLVSTTMNGDSLSAVGPGDWINVPFTPILLSSGIKYAILITNEDSDVNNYIAWAGDRPVPTYLGGTSFSSNDYGASWIADANKDLFFEEYGYSVFDASVLLINHSGNSTALSQNGNISKIEFRAKSNLSSGSYNGEISLQPVWNNTNGTSYNVFSTSTASWSDWIDITQDVNYSHPDWNDTRELQCRVIANISSGTAFVGMVEIRVSVNRTLDYAYNTTLVSSPTVYTGVTTSQPILGLTPGQVYFYRNKINTSYINSSSYYYGDEHYFLTKPYAPTVVSSIPINETCINISWTKGTGANTTVIVTKTTGKPASPYDGTIVYNGTGTYFLLNVTKGTPSYTRAWSYDAWSVNPILWHFSDNYTEFNWSIVGFNVFNESRLPYLEAIGFDLEITNREGTFVYYATNCNNTHFVNITNIPTGTNIHIIIRNNTNYRFRDYYMDVLPATIYNESFYLPTLTTETPGPEDDCSLRTSIDSISISSNATDATITLQHDLEEIISVELYNDSLYGTYGGWLFIASSNYTSTTNTVIVNKSVLDINTTMIRVQYYYMYCVGTVIETPLYYLRVVETIETEYTEVDRGVQNAIVNIKRYVNDSGIYETVAGPMTDANGYVNVYLIPNALYKVFINKTGYEEMIADYIPAPPNEWGQTTEKIFRIISLSTGIENVTIPPGFYDHIIFNGTMFTNGSIFVNYVDLSSETINAQFYTYMMYNYSRLLIDTQNTVLDSFQYWITGINASKQHMVTIFLNHTTLGAVTTSIFLGPVNNTLYHDPAIVENAAIDVYGNFDLGYVRFFIEWLPFIGILVVLGRIEAGMGIFGGALYLALVGKFFGDLPAELWQILPIILLFAVLWYIATKGKFRL